jgi:hypothetical protein
MSDSESNDLSGGMEPPVAEAKRYADGKTLVAELRARALRQMAEAEYLAYQSMCKRESMLVIKRYIDILACRKVLAMLDDLNGCDAETQTRHGSRNS